MILIKNGTIMDPASDSTLEADLLIADGKILKIGEQLERSEEYRKLPRHEIQYIDADGYVIAPGLVDVHVHFRDPGFTQKEDIITGAAAAAKGGFTSVVLMANTNPVVDNEETLDYILKKGEKTGIRVYTCGTVTKGMAGKEIADLSRMKEHGAVGFTDDGKPILDPELVRAAMEKCRELDVPISFHEEDPFYIKQNGVNSGEVAAHLGLEGSDRQAEITMVKRDLELALETGAAVNIQHISTKEAVELVREAKAKGGDIHAEATPHHFTLTQDAVKVHGTNAKMNPPLREEADRLAIIEALADGTIDLIATDHAPHTKEEKNRPFAEAPSGIIGLETALALGVNELVKTGKLTLMELLRKMSTNPARLYHLDAGYISEGGPADLVIFDPDCVQTFFQFLSKSKNTPFAGKTCKSEVEYTICGGKVAYIKTMAIEALDD